MSWEVAQPRSKHIKIFMFGPAGCWKTRVMLRLGNVPKDHAPALAVLDSEFGTDHYADQFTFHRKQTTNCDEITKYVQAWIKNPDGLTAIGIDSYTIYDKSLVSKWVHLYLKRLPTSSGHKTEFYILQPNDHQNINGDRDEFIRMLLESKLNVFVTAEIKNEWEGLKVIGKTFDAPERFEHFFDTVIEIKERGTNLIGYKAHVHKDRSYRLKKNAEYDWDSEEQAYELMKVFNLLSLADPYVGPVEKEKPAVDTPQPPPFETNQVVSPEIADLLRQVGALKTELHITAKDAWDKLLVPYNVPTAKSLTEEQLKEFINTLEGMRPS